MSELLRAQRLEDENANLRLAQRKATSSIVSAHDYAEQMEQEANRLVDWFHYIWEHYHDASKIGDGPSLHVVIGQILNGDEVPE